MKQQKTYKIRQTYSPLFGAGRPARQTIYEGTLQELIAIFQYTLESGKSYEYYKGCKRINTQPRTIRSLISNIYNAKNNAASNGYSGYFYDLV